MRADDHDAAADAPDRFVRDSFMFTELSHIVDEAAEEDRLVFPLQEDFAIAQDRHFLRVFIVAHACAFVQRRL